MDRSECLKLEIERFTLQFHSLRSVEWQVAFQAMAGYAAIAAGFHSLLLMRDGKLIASPWIGLSASFCCVLVFLLTRYLSCRIQERMHETSLQIDLLRQRLWATVAREDAEVIQLLNLVQSQPNTERLFFINSAPIHRLHYAHRAQLAANALWLVGVCTYTTYRTDWRSLCALFQCAA